MVPTHETPYRTTDDEQRLRARLNAGLTRASGRPVVVVSIERQRSPYAGVFPAEVITAHLEHGGTTRVFAKYIGNEQADHPDKQCRDRELKIYSELFPAGGELPVVRCYSAQWDEPLQRYELLLEHIDDWNLKYHDLEHWYAAARALARLHDHFAQRAQQLRKSPWLVCMDAAYFRSWAERALQVLAGRWPQLGKRLRPVVEDYADVAAFLAAQPPTLVHNDLSPKNVLASRSSEPVRVWFIDWEMAGVGCGLLDLVHLKYGLEPQANDAMIRAYREALEGSSWLPADSGAFARLLGACELHKSFYRIAHAQTWGLPESTLAKWIECEIEPSFEQARQQ